MAGTKEGYEKAQAKLLERYGGPAGLRKHREAIGRKGGKISRGGGFATMDPVKHKEASSKGGKNKARVRLDNNKDDVVD